MGIGFQTMKRLMQSSNNHPISDRSVHVMIAYIESHIEDLTERSISRHHEINKLREVHGLYQKKKLSDDIVKEVLKEVLNDGD